MTESKYLCPEVAFYRPRHLLLNDFLSNVTAIERDTASNKFFTNFIKIANKPVAANSRIVEIHE